jgi:hypothetical protein
MKKYILSLGLPLVLFGLVKISSAATLTLTPASGAYTANDTFTVNVNVNTSGQTVDGVDLYYLRYNPAILEVQDSNGTLSGIQISPGSLLPQTLSNTVDAATGRITFSQVTTGGTTYNGSGVLATITFKAKANGTSSVAFDFTLGSTSDTNVAGGGTDRLTSVSNASFTVTGGSDPTPPPPPPPPPTPPGTPIIVRPDHYPTGTIFKYANNATVYIKEGTIARPITDWSVYVNQVPATRSIITIPSTVTFTNGAVLGLRNATLIKASNDPTVYLILDGKRFAFSTAQQFFDHNYNFSNVYVIDDVNLVNSIPISTDTFQRPVGTLFKYANSPAVYFLNTSRLKRGYTTIGMFNIWNATLKDVVTIPDTETYPDGPIATLPNGIVVKGSTSTIYFVYDGILRPFTDMNLFSAMGLTNAMIKTYSDADIALHTIGAAME